MAMTDFKLIRRSLFSRFFSSVTTTIMVAIAVGLMIILLIMPDAGRDAFMRGSGNMHMLVSRDTSSLQAVLNGIFYAEKPRKIIDWPKYEQLRQRFRILEYAIPIQLGDSYQGHPVLAADEAFFSQYMPHLDVGWVFTEGGPFEKPFEVVMGADAARKTKAKIGQALHLTHGSSDASEENDHKDFEYVVVGILEKTGGPHDRAIFTDLNSSWIIHAHARRERELGHVETTTIEDLTDKDRDITGIYIRVATREGSALSAAQQMVFNQLRSDTTITVADPQQEISKLFTIVESIDQIFLAMAAIVMFSSGISIMLVLYNSMEQRRRQIAVLRVLGCSRGRIFGLIVTESAILGIAGSIAGIILAYYGAQIVAWVMNDRLGLVIDPRLPYQESALIAIATILLASIAGVVPAFMAYRTPVVKNLRPLG